MMRALAIVLALSACSCATAPIAPGAQGQLEQLAARYTSARAIEVDHCPNAPPCESVRRAGYDAEAAYTQANVERTAPAIAAARAAIEDYWRSTAELQP